MKDARIEILDNTTADQIAAGEVVERPGSVVKELIENSLDAGATKIVLDIDSGGVGRIRVLDNGTGIKREQVKTAFLRHATSKMRCIEDLQEVLTFGFRGEALPSIASVSRIAINTRTAEDTAGYRLVLEAGKVIEERDVGCPVGTEIEVKDLFFNTPARLKFLKKETTEAAHCAEALVRAAAVRPDVFFQMRSSGRVTRELPRVEKVEERVSSMFPKERLVRAEGSEHATRVLAVLGPPETAKSGAMSLYTYVNGRFVRDKIILGALTRAFGGTLENGRYPVGLLSLEIPPSSIDINVHPQKTEVRFANTDVVFRAISKVVGEAVARGAWSFFSKNHIDRAMEPEAASYSPSSLMTDIEASLNGLPNGRLIPLPIQTSLTNRWVNTTGTSSEYINRRIIPSGNDVSDAENPKQNIPSENSSACNVFDMQADMPDVFAFSRLKYIGQAQNLFLLFEDIDDLVIIDQHAAHERITYERFRKDLEKGNIASQGLLIPHNVDLGPADADRIINLADDLMRLGLEVTRSGLDRITIHRIPAELSDAAPDRLLAEMVPAVEEGRKGSKGEWAEKALATMACHNSIRAGRKVDTREIESLLKQMDEAEFKGHCPHGRPVLTRISFKDIRRRLHR